MQGLSRRADCGAGSIRRRGGSVIVGPGGQGGLTGLAPCCTGEPQAAIGRDKQVIRSFSPQGSPIRRWLAAVLLGIAVVFAAAPAGARDLSVVLNDGFAPTALREAYLRSFTESLGVAVEPLRWEGGLAALQARLEARPPWDVVVLSGAELLGACDAGLVEKLDWAALGGRERMLPAGASDCGVGVAMRATILSWDRDKLQAMPGWAEFWDVVRLPGKRGLRRHPRTTLEFALLADGVAAGEVYRTLRSEAGVDRAFRRLDQLRPYIVWWQDEVEAARLLASGEVLMTSAPSVVVAEANRRDGRNFALQWTGGVTSVAAMAIVKGSAKQAEAMRLLAHAADPRTQALLSATTPYGAVARGALERLAPEQLALLPTSPAALAATLPADEVFWRDNLAKLTQRFDAWLPR